MTVQATAQVPVSVTCEPVFRLIPGLSVPAPIAEAPASPRWRGSVSPTQWMAIRQAYFAERMSVPEVARHIGVSRRKVRAVLWSFQAA